MDWESQPFFVLDDMQYDTVLKLLRNNEEVYSHSKVCPHIMTTCTCPKMLNEHHPSWGICRRVNGVVRPVFRSRHVFYEQPLGNKEYAKTYPEQILQYLSDVDPDLISKSAIACKFLEEHVVHHNQKIKEDASRICAQLCTSSRLKHMIKPEMNEFVISWNGFCFDFQQEPQGRPIYSKGLINDRLYAITYYLLGDEPAEVEPIGTALSQLHFCATKVYAKCKRLDNVSSTAKKKLLHHVHTQNVCATCGVNEFRKVTYPFTGDASIVSGASLDYLLFVLNEVRYPLKKVKDGVYKCLKADWYVTVEDHVMLHDSFGRLLCNKCMKNNERDEQVDNIKEDNTDIDMQVALLNEDARQKKLSTRKAIIQPALSSFNELNADIVEPQQTTPSNKSLKRKEKRAKQKNLTDKKALLKRNDQDEEFKKILKTVGRDVKECDYLPISIDKRQQIKTYKKKSEYEITLAHELKNSSSIREKMTNELHAFLRDYSGVAPDDIFVDNLMFILTGGEVNHKDDSEAAERVFGEFSTAFVNHEWVDARLRSVKRRLVLHVAASSGCL